MRDYVIEITPRRRGCPAFKCPEAPRGYRTKRAALKALDKIDAWHEAKRLRLPNATIVERIVEKCQSWMEDDAA